MKRLNIVVEIQFRDDKVVKYDCVDNPSIANFVTLYKKDLERIFIPSEAIKQIKVTVK